MTAPESRPSRPPPTGAPVAPARPGARSSRWSPLGGAIGAAARYAPPCLAHPAGGFPWTTFWINVVGCAVIGVFMVVITEVWAAHRLVRPFFGTGVLGGFTTFSTYAVDIQQLVDGGRPAHRPGLSGRDPARGPRRGVARGHGDPPRPAVEAAMTRLTGSALRLTVFVGENDTWHHKPLYTEIVHRAHAAGLAGRQRLPRHRGLRRVLPDPHLPAAVAQRGPAGGDRHRRHRGARTRVPAAAGRTGHRGTGDPRRSARSSGTSAAARTPGREPGQKRARRVRSRCELAAGRRRRHGRRPAALSDRPRGAVPARHGLPLGHLRRQRHRLSDPRRC